MLLADRGFMDIKLMRLMRQLGWHFRIRVKFSVFIHRATKGKRKVKALEVLLQDEEVKKAIFAFVHRKLDVLLSHVRKYQFPITWNVERKVLVKDFLLEVKPKPLLAHLSFKRTEEEVQYQMQLANGQGPFFISEKEVIPITNHPAWLFVDHQLFKVEHINGNMVKPFRQRNLVRIPKDKMKTYFQKFIVKLASRVDIQAEGFDVVGLLLGVEGDHAEAAGLLVGLFVAVGILADFRVFDGHHVDLVAEPVLIFAGVGQAVLGSVLVRHADVVGSPPARVAG